LQLCIQMVQRIGYLLGQGFDVCATGNQKPCQIILIGFYLLYQIIDLFITKLIVFLASGRIPWPGPTPEHFSIAARNFIYIVQLVHEGWWHGRAECPALRCAIGYMRWPAVRYWERVRMPFRTGFPCLYGRE